MYEFWYDYVKIKYQDKARLCYMDADSFVVNIKTKGFYKDISQDVNKRFDTSNYTFDRLIPTGINKKVIGLMKDELGGDIITEFVALRPKAYPYITNNFIEMKKAKGTKKCVVNKMLIFDDYKKSSFDNGKVLKSQGFKLTFNFNQLLNQLLKHLILNFKKLKYGSQIKQTTH